MKKIFKLLLAVTIPLCTAAQVQVQKTDSANITTILPFYSSAVLQNATLRTFSITVANRPSTIPVPPDNIYDSAYDETDDTTYDYKPILNYGAVINTNLGISDGNWQVVSGGKLWTLKISVDSAFNTSIHMDSFSLSPTASFYIVNGDGSVVKGPFTKDAMSGISTFGTFPMDGNSCYLFLFEPNDYNVSLNNFAISGVVGGYQPIGEFELPSRLNTGGTERLNPTRCVPSIRCYEDWMNSARAVSRWSNGGGGACSGTLLNDETGDGISYYYSAQHCLPNPVGSLARAAFQFQFWQTGCNTGVNQPFIEFFGATLLHTVAYNSGDAILLRLNSGPGVGDGPTYAGWSRQNSNPSKNTGGIIHHPRAGDMRFTKPAKIRDFLWNRDFWKVSYYSGTGLVLPGSSGSGLFNDNHQVIGCLSRGFPQTCFFRMSGDRFGKFHKGWDGMGQFLSPAANNFEMSSLSLSTLTIQGNTVIGCNTTPQTYSIQNLIGCNYTWTASNNLNIVAGAGTNTISVVYTGGSQQIETDWVNVVINDSKGSFPNGRRAEFRLNIQTGQKITGTIEQQGYPIVPLNTVNFIKPDLYAHSEFTSQGCTSTSAALTGGSPQWSFTNTGSYGHLYVMLTSGQSATFNITATNASCGLIQRTVTYVAASWGYFYEVNPNPASTYLTIKAVKDENDVANSSRKLTDLEYNVQLIDFMTGALVRKIKVNKGETTKQLNVSDLKRGHYIVQIIEGKNKTIRHIILQ